MLLKKFFYHRKSLFGKINRKKFLLKNFYEKFLIRSNLMDSNTIKVLDTDTQIYNVQTANLARLVFNKTSNLEGFSFNARKILYANKRNNLLRFESFLCNFSSQHNVLENTYRSLKCFKKKNKSLLNPVIVLKPIKGGFRCYCSGAVGFLPGSQARKAKEKHFFFSIKKQVDDSNEKHNYINYILTEGKFTDKYFIPRILLKLSKAEISSRYKRKNFSASSRKKKYYGFGHNFVFILRK
jgi:hypothetical protein